MADPRGQQPEIDRILDIIDAGHQTSKEPGYGYDSIGLCVRCQLKAPTEGEFCQPCRVFAVGDDQVAGPLTGLHGLLLAMWEQLEAVFTRAKEWRRWAA